MNEPMEQWSVCRARGEHTWDPPNEEDVVNMEAPQRCTVCKTRRWIARRADGSLMAKRYEYPHTL